ncbi:MAG: LysM peptidoglycan-binding domain-containing protein [Thermoguttaceae bacterium]
MNDPAVKLALAISVLVGGTFLATILRPDLTLSGPTISELNKPLSLQTLRHLPTSPHPDNTSLSRLKVPTTESSREPVILTAIVSPRPIPNLPPRYPLSASTSSGQWSNPVDMMPVVARKRQEPLIHQIVDGDTLPDLAAKYLGSADRAAEIFQANRDTLSNPNILPIGAQLKIPCGNGK